MKTIELPAELIAKDMYIKYKDKQYNLEQLLDNIFSRIDKLETNTDIDDVWDDIDDIEMDSEFKEEW